MSSVKGISPSGFSKNLHNDSARSRISTDSGKFSKMPANTVNADITMNESTGVSSTRSIITGSTLPPFHVAHSLDALFNLADG